MNGSVSILPAALLGVGYLGAPPLVSGLLTLLLLYRAGKVGRLTTWGGNKVLQYFGRISYSLYLVHLTIVVVVLKFGYKLTGHNHVAAVFWFVLSGVISVGAAHLLHIAVERPSMRFASRLKTAPTLAVVHGQAAPTPVSQTTVAANSE